MRGVVAAAVCALIAAGVAFAASPLPGTKTPADRKAWRAILHWPAVCEKDWNAGTPGDAGVSVWPPAHGTRLVEVSCIRGAYQGTFMLYLVDSARHKVGPLSLLTYVDPGNGNPKPKRQTVILGGVVFTPANGKLTVLDKFRGVGDCGIYSTFKLVGTKFVPTEVRAKLACDGKPPFDPARWPKLPLPKG